MPRSAEPGGGPRWLTARSGPSEPFERERIGQAPSGRSASRPSTATWPSGSPTARSRASSRWAPAPARFETFEVPGAFELPLAAKLCADSGRFAGVACLGVVIRGETDHYDFVCAEAASGLRQVTLETGIPCSFGVITCDTREQAEARAGGGKRDQGRNAAIAAVQMHLMSADERLG